MVRLAIARRNLAGPGKQTMAATAEQPRAAITVPSLSGKTLEKLAAGFA
jgi:hypothetical protein